MKARIKALLSAKPVLPGSLEEHYNVCGKAGCRCKDKVNPRKHGPYYRLSYSVKGENSSVFVRKEDAEMIREMTGNYREARSNIQELSLEMVRVFRKEGLHGMLAKHRKLTEGENNRKSGAKPVSAIIRRMRASRGKWKSKALARQDVLEKNRVKIRDLEKSREKWKNKAIKAQKRIEGLQKKVVDAEKEISEIVKSADSKKNYSWRRRRSD